MATSTFSGIAVYEILPNGCLNGVYSNDHPDTQNEIFNEIARKVSEDGADTIVGKYVCCYISIGNEACNCDLEIQIATRRKRNGQYDLIWSRNKKVIFEGTGWKTRGNQLTVSYRDCK